MRPEVTTQRYVYRHAKSDVSAPHVPEIVQFFESGEMGYVVMEFINITSPPALETAAGKVADALRWLSVTKKDTCDTR